MPNKAASRSADFRAWLQGSSRPAVQVSEARVETFQSPPPLRTSPRARTRTHTHETHTRPRRASTHLVHFHSDMFQVQAVGEDEKVGARPQLPLLILLSCVRVRPSGCVLSCPWLGPWCLAYFSSFYSSRPYTGESSSLGREGGSRGGGGRRDCRGGWAPGPPAFSCFPRTPWVGKLKIRGTKAAPLPRRLPEPWRPQNHSSALPSCVQSPGWCDSDPFQVVSEV